MRVAAAQAVAVEGDLAANVATAVRLVELAATQAVRLVLLPEAFLTGYSRAAFAGAVPCADDLVDDGADDWADDRAGDWLAPLRDAARAAGCTVVVSTPLRRGDVKTLSQLVIDPDGSVSAPYDKQHLSGHEKDHFVPGEHGASILVDGLELGLSICYDGCFPEHARAAAADGAIAYLNSAAYFAGSEHRRDLYYRARAIDNGMYVVFAGLTGTCGPATFCGGSAIHDPEGRTVASIGTEEGLAIAELDPALVAATRADHPMLAERRTTLGHRVRA